MNADFLLKQTSRREMLRGSAAIAGGAFLAHLFPATILRASAQAPHGGDASEVRTQLGAIPIQTQKLADNLTLLSGPGGNVMVLNGPDGKFVVDTFLSPAWPKLREALDGIGNAPLKYVIDTHWHFDHTDNNAPLHAAGATVLAHENTKKRMLETHDLPVFGFHFPPSPAEALPQETFGTSRKLQGNGETIELQHFPPAHTDSDIYVHFQKGDVVHMGDTFFNGMYPYIDSSTGGKVGGMIAASDKVLGFVGNDTKIVPGHGPVGSKADLVKYREMLVTARGRVQKFKTAGKSAQEAVAEKPLADLDAVWAQGMLNSDQFVQVLYLAL